MNCWFVLKDNYYYAEGIIGYNKPIHKLTPVIIAGKDGMYSLGKAKYTPRNMVELGYETYKEDCETPHHWGIV